MATKLTFHGGAGTVTGSCYLLEHGGQRLLIDCGMFQGNKTLRELNYRPLPFRPAEIDCLLLTHAHIDHTGLVPRLVKLGFARPILASAPTIDLASFMLPDSGQIQESEVERLNRRNRRAGRPEIQPIYTEQDAKACIGQMRPVEFGRWVSPTPGIEARLWNAGHILGSASIELKLAEAAGGPPLQMLFSGDLGPDEKVFHPEPDAPAGVDYLLCESTYGDRDRADATVVERRAVLAKEIDQALRLGGKLVIPAFAVERFQELLHDIGVLLAQQAIPPVPVFLDSPLAKRATEVFIRHAASLGDVALNEQALFRDPNFRFTESVEDSKAINQVEGPAIIMAASGMCEAGRIRHHLRNTLWRPDTTVLFVGYQAPGTLGQIILDGAKEVVIHGTTVAVKARIRTIGNYSAHADQQGLVQWVKERLPVRHSIFLTHGEEPARQELRRQLTGLGIAPERILLPGLDQSVELIAAGQPALAPARPRVDPAQIETDWQNEHAALVLALDRTLRALPGPAERRALLQRLQAQLPG